MSLDYHKTPFPWFGGKSDAAPLVWRALGDVEHYVEPFAGSLAVLMRRPHVANRGNHSETVNDLDGLLVNAWRSIQWSPDATAEAASWPVTEADMHARHLALLKWRSERQLEHLMGDPRWHDPEMAGWWLWGQCAWIGSGWCSGQGPWVVGADGRIEQRKGAAGVNRKRPHLSDDGKGVNTAAVREEGVSWKRPHLSNDGRGVNTAAVREEGVRRQLPHLSDNGRGVNTAAVREEGVGDYHPMTMPELRRWFAFLSARLRHVRVLNGDWKRAVTGGAVRNLGVRGGGFAGVFVDPPYSEEADRASLYTEESFTVARDVRAWAREMGAMPDVRIVLAGYDVEHRELLDLGWREVEWYRGGFLRGGMGNVGGSGKHQQHRERLWLSPACLDVEERKGQASLFG